MFELVKSTALTKLESELMEVKKHSDAIKEVDSSNYSEVINTLTMLTKLDKKMDKERLAIVKPYNEKITEFKATVDAVRSIAQEAHENLTPKYMGYVKELERVEKERQAELAKKEAEGIRLKAEKEAEEMAKVAEQSNIYDFIEQASDHIDTAEKMATAVENKEINVNLNLKSEMGSIHFRDNWKGSVVDMPTFVKWCLDNDQLRFLEAKGLDDLAKFKKQEGIFNGIQVTNNKSMVGKSKW